MIKIIVFSLVILSVLVHTINSLPLTAAYTVHILDMLPNRNDPLKFRCQSKDNDFGDKTLDVGGEFNFSFNWHAFGGTRFYCHYYWGSKQAIFDIVNSDVSNGCERDDIYKNHYQCYWMVQGDGFYFAGHNAAPAYVKKHDWN